MTFAENIIAKHFHGIWNGYLLEIFAPGEGVGLDLGNAVWNGKGRPGISGGILNQLGGYVCVLFQFSFVIL